MSQKESLKRMLKILEPHLAVPHDGEMGSVVVMMCGVSGAGKSTLSSAIVDAFPTFTRLSIDGILAERHGIYNINYPASEYEAHLEEATQVFEETTQTLLIQKKNIVLDSAFYDKKRRDEYKAKVERQGGRWVLVYLNAERDVLWRRICERRAKGINADSARDISPALLDQFVRGFEVPNGEGEIVIVSE